MALNPTFSWLASLDPLSLVSVSSYVVFSEWRTLSSASLSDEFSFFFFLNFILFLNFT